MQTILNHLIKEHHIERDRALKAVEGWDFIDMELNGVKYGELMVQNNEVHFALVEDKRLKLGKKQLMKSVFNDLFKDRDFLVTALFKGDKKRTKLIEFFGFTKTHSDDQRNYFWLNKEDCVCLQ